MQDTWELEIHTSEEASEAVADLLLRAGASGVATEDPNEISRILNEADTLIFSDAEFFNNLPDFVRIRAYFTAESEVLLRQHIEHELDNVRAYLELSHGIVACRKVQEKDWAEAWKAHYHPLKVSKRVVICPSWESYHPEEGEIVITLDPGSAFGTGEHASTALCIQILDAATLEHESILDLGCGSGVLAITAAKLGAKNIEAVDIDPNAVEVARMNVLQNNCQEQITCYTAELAASLRDSYSLIIANILADVHVDLVSQYREKLHVNGVLILSGIITHKVEWVKDTFAKEKFELLDEKKEDDWFALKYRKV